MKTKKTPSDGLEKLASITTEISQHLGRLIDNVDWMAEVLESLIETVENTGGAYKVGSDWFLVYSPDWGDLAEAYIAACAVLGRKPKVVARPKTKKGARS